MADIRRDAFSVSKTFTYRWDDPDADHPGDVAQDILSTPLLAEPGTTFAYRGANTYLLSRIIHGCSGQDLRDYLIPRLFTPWASATRSGSGARSGTPSARSGSCCARRRSPDWVGPCWSRAGMPIANSPRRHTWWE
ncbi:MAG: serine hydrolase [Actinobacteria bacterium]|nr:serine hydrolase [Actinomycetota bacterium]